MDLDLLWIELSTELSRSTSLNVQLLAPKKIKKQNHYSSVPAKMKKKEVKDRLLAGYMLYAIGDVLASSMTTEFKVPEQGFRVPKFKEISAICQFSSMTEMVLCLLADFIDYATTYSRKRMITTYAKWVGDEKRSPVPQPIKRLFLGVNKSQTYVKRYASGERQRMLDSGSLTIARIPGLLPRALMMEDVREMVGTENSITSYKEDNSATIFSCIAFLRMAECLVRGGTVETAVNECADSALVPEVKKIVQDAIVGQRKSVLKMKGKAYSALYTSVYCLSNNESLEDEIRWILSTRGERMVFIPTTMFIIGLQHGMKELAKSAVIVDILKEMAECDTTDGEYKRPRQYTFSTYVGVIKECAKKVINSL
jgi:hypothetical protein